MYNKFKTWLTIKLIESHIKCAEEEQKNEDNTIIEKARNMMISNWKNAIMYLKANRNK